MASFLDSTGLGHLIEKIKATFVSQADTQTVQALDIDSTPTANSTNLVTSGGVKSYVDGHHEIPSGGSQGQVLAKSSGTDYALEWVNQSGGSNPLPTGGTAGQVLAKASGTDYDVEWGNIPSSGTASLPAGGSKGQTLVKQSAIDGDAIWMSLYKYGVVSQTLTWTSNQYSLSAQVYGFIPQANIDLFERCGASFNATGDDTTATDLYGRSFTHKAGCFMLNGLGDISYQEMLYIYNYANITQPFSASTGEISPHILESCGARTNLWTFSQNWSTRTSLYMFACYNGGSNLTTVRIKANDADDAYIGAARQAFTSAGRVEYIYPALECSNLTGTGTAANSFYGAFDNCANLKEIRLKSLKISVALRHSSRLSLASVKYMIDNEASTAAMTITLHATVYSAAIADTGIQSSLSNHPNVTLASA